MCESTLWKFPAGVCYYKPEPNARFEIKSHWCMNVIKTGWIRPQIFFRYAHITCKFFWLWPWLVMVSNRKGRGLKGTVSPTAVEKAFFEKVQCRRTMGYNLLTNFLNFVQIQWLSMWINNFCSLNTSCTQLVSSLTHAFPLTPALPGKRHIQ